MKRMDLHETRPTFSIIVGLLLVCHGIDDIQAAEDFSHSSTATLVATLIDIDNLQGSIEHANISPRRERQFGYPVFAVGFGGFGSKNGFGGYGGFNAYGGGSGGGIQREHSVTRTTVINRYSMFSGIFGGGYGGVFGGGYAGGYGVKYGGSGGYGLYGF